MDVFSSANQIGFKISFNAADFGLGAGDTLWIGFSGFPQCRTNYLYRMTSTSTPPSDFVINTMGFTLRFVFRSDGSQVGPGFDITVKRLYKKSTYPAIQAVGNAMYFDINSGAFRAGVQAASSNMGVYSTALGSANTASGYASTALGESNTASGSVSTALGSANTASGYASTALGESNTASGNASTALGQGNTASGNASTALGYFNTASGHYSTALGYFNTASGHYSTALGYLNTASGSASTALGYNNTAKASHSFVVGRYNDTIAGSNPNFWVPTDPLFMVGNGSSSTQRSNAVTVYKNGNTDIKGFTRLGDDAPRIQTKLLTTISPPTQGAYIAVNHGLTFSKIISVTAVLTITSSEQGIIPGYRTNNGYEYGLTYDNIGIYISNHPTNSANILSQPVKIFITYIE
ncbi:MAG: hypothetical protein IPM26_12665 [Saprospiraceae bacterium]|nr:hypothetical protein [Saprospiraceae bacterium]